MENGVVQPRPSADIALKEHPSLKIISLDPLMESQCREEKKKIQRSHRAPYRTNHFQVFVKCVELQVTQAAVELTSLARLKSQRAPRAGWM
jgi:hypothetical protein